MGGLNRWSEPELPPTKLSEVPQPPQQRRRFRRFWIGVVILALLVLFGIAIFLARITGAGPAKPGTPKPTAPGIYMTPGSPRPTINLA